MTAFNKHSFHTTKRHKIQSLCQIFKQPEFQIQNLQAHTPPRIDLSIPKLQRPRAPKDPKQRSKDVKQPPNQKFQTRKKQQTKMDDTCAARSICGFDLGGSGAGSGQECRKDKIKLKPTTQISKCG